MNMSIKPQSIVSACVIGLLVLGISCSDKSSNPGGAFDVYGRIVFRPTLAQPQSEAIFYLFHNGQPIRRALIIVRQDTVPVVDSLGGYYRRSMTVSIGDTVSYHITSDFGTTQGQVIIPDTVSIIRPVSFPFADTVFTGVDFSAIWHEGSRVDGYFAYLEDQSGLVASVKETQFDTTAMMPGINLNQIGADRFWLETLSGAISSAVAPDGKTMPKGVAGAAANYREVFVAPQR